MKYRIEEYKLKNGIEDISIIFDEKYQLLTTFMSCDVLPFEKWIKSGFDGVQWEICSEGAGSGRLTIKSQALK